MCLLYNWVQEYISYWCCSQNFIGWGIKYNMFGIFVLFFRCSLQEIFEIWNDNLVGSKFFSVFVLNIFNERNSAGSYGHNIILGGNKNKLASVLLVSCNRIEQLMIVFDIKTRGKIFNSLEWKIILISSGQAIILL